jgi:hypothetical protein
MPLDAQLLEQLQQNNTGLTSLDLSRQSLKEQDIPN